jgi:hypothetical protein
MKQKDKLIRAYTGTEITVILLKGRLEEIGIFPVIQDDYKSGINVGFVGGVQSAVDLYIQQSDYKKAEPVINEFIERNKA